MSSHIFVLSEWLSKENQDQVLFDSFKKLATLALEKEKGCVKYHVTRQISHAATKNQSKYTIILFQEYVNEAEFDAHCHSEHVAEFVKNNLALVEDWRCRILSEGC